MKNVGVKAIWLGKQIRPFIHYLLMIVIFGASISLIGIYRAIISKRLIDAATSSQTNKLLGILILFAVSILLDMGLRAAVSIVSANCSIRISNSIQQKLYSRIMKIKWMEFSKYHSGDILTRLTSDVDAVTGMITNTIPFIITMSVSLIGSFLTLLYMDRVLALVLIVLSPSSILLSYFYSTKLKKMYTKSQELESKYRSFLNESIQNMVIVKSFCLEDENINKVSDIQKNRVKLTLTRTKVSVVANFVLSSGYWVGYFLVFCWSTLKLSKGTTTFGTLTAMLQLIGNIQSPIYGLASSLPQVIAAIASTERLMEIENLKLDNEGLISENVNSVGVLVDNVDFSYKKDVPVLQNVSVTINPGETVALVGPSGEGKTTFVHLILSLINPESGHIYIGNEIQKNEVCADTRKFISYVPQGNTLFSGTIADNLRFGCPNATDEELEIAAKAACAWNFIKNSPNGLNTHVGERGSGLSEGQAQRLAIARALLCNAPILILDEATSALDTKTEIEVLKTIKKLNPSPTCIIITHRTTALEICNKVFKLEDCHVIEQSSAIEESAIFSSSVAAII